MYNHRDDGLDSWIYAMDWRKANPALMQHPELLIDERRPCSVSGVRGMFHKWVDIDQPIVKFGLNVSPERTNKVMVDFDTRHLLPAGTTFENVRTSMGLVEFPDGSVGTFEPSAIVFSDNKIVGVLNAERDVKFTKEQRVDEKAKASKPIPGWMQCWEKGMFMKIADDKLRMTTWIGMLRIGGVKAAHPDDECVDKKSNYIHLFYPQFNDGIKIGDSIALGTPEKWRVVKVTRICPSFLSRDMVFYYFESADTSATSKKVNVACFKDGHTEEIISFEERDCHLEFTTKSGKYMYVFPGRLLECYFWKQQHINMTLGSFINTNITPEFTTDFVAAFDIDHIQFYDKPEEDRHAES